jgi:hypothetical protein
LAGDEIYASSAELTKSLPLGFQTSHIYIFNERVANTGAVVEKGHFQRAAQKVVIAVVNSTAPELLQPL